MQDGPVKIHVFVVFWSETSDGLLIYDCFLPEDLMIPGSEGKSLLGLPNEAHDLILDQVVNQRAHDLDIDKDDGTAMHELRKGIYLELVFRGPINLVFDWRS